MPEKSPLKILLDTLPQRGRVEWIGIRPARGITTRVVEGGEVALGDKVQACL